MNEKSLIAPKINDLYNQKSKHLVEKVKRMFRINILILLIMSVVIPVVHYFLDVFFWEGISTSILLLLTAWYSVRQIQNIKTLDQGATSLDYLKSFDRWLKDVILRSGKIVRFSYPLYFIIAISIVWSTFSKQEHVLLSMRQKFPDLIFIGDTPLVALVAAGISTLLMAYFSDKIYKWDVRLMYGRVFSKLEQTIAEMEKLKQE